jgi:hypothetical protein
MKLRNIVTEATRTLVPYYKVTTKPDARIPGYLTKKKDIVRGYLSAFLDSGALKAARGGTDDPVYVVECYIDTSKLKAIEGVAFWDQDKRIKPGYYGTQVDPDEGIEEPLDVIVWNNPIKTRIVGAYLPSKNIDVTKPYGGGRYIKEGPPHLGRAWRLPNYTTDDIDEL